jgi:HK97 gp10 family phage protein
VPDITLSDNTSAVLDALEGGAEHFIEALATAIRDQFQSNVHVITGAMKASASVITPNGSDYAEHVAAAAALNPNAEFAPEEQVGPGEAIVQVPVNYAGYEEFGTIHQSAHPALVPAVESVVANADAIAREVFGF